MMIFPLLLALSGFIAGMALSFFVPEELRPGQKYFRIVKTGLLAALAVALGYFLWGKAAVFSIFLVSAVVLLAINLEFTYPWLELFNYSFLIIFYFLLPEKNFQLFIASFIFIYGLPAGTLVRTIDYESRD